LSREHRSAATAYSNAAEEFLLLAGACPTHAIIHALPDLLDVSRLSINNEED